VKGSLHDVQTDLSIPDPRRCLPRGRRAGGDRAGWRLPRRTRHRRPTGVRTAHADFVLDYSRPASNPFWQIVVADPQRDTMFARAVYRRGAMTLQALREKIGDGPFFQILRTWAEQHKYGTTTTEEFIALSEQISGQDLSNFFNVWLYTKGKPTSW
jgi:aminopeptidase N